MQAFSRSPWTPPGGTLGELTVAAHQRAEMVEGRMAELRAASADAPPPLPFAAALRDEHIRVIGEVKRASPSKGPIAEGLDATAQGLIYGRGGAAAVSVLTEPTRFGGSLQDLRDVSERVALPTIRKDFLVHPVQLWEARAHGASAVLLIVRALSPDRLRELLAVAAECGLETLVEVRTESELALALESDARVIGVNNRDLESLVIDPATAPALIPHLPSDRIAVAESGMRSADDVRASADAGADAILVGSALSSAADPAALLDDLTRIPRRARR